MNLFSFLPRKKKYVLVISWWGTRGFYALGILKWLEELGYKDKIDAIYGVSAGAILASYWSAGYSAQEIFDRFYQTKNFINIFSLNLLSKKSLLKNQTLADQFTKDLPKHISDLSKKVYIWATDVTTGKFILFHKDELVPALLWSIAIPGIFPAIKHAQHILIDGGVSNNFPVEKAKKTYPGHKIIWIALNKFKEHQKIESIFDTLSVSFEILLRTNTLEALWLVDHLFYKEIGLKILDTNKKNMHKAYLQGYEDCINHFKI